MVVYMLQQNKQATLPGMEDDLAAAPPAPEPAERNDQPAPVSSSRLAGKTVYVIDTNSLVFQVFHAIPEMTSPRGEPVNAVFGFTRDLLYIIQAKRPDYLFAALDMPGPTFRHELYGDYKLHRAEMPSELVPQIPMVYQVLEALGIPLLGLESFEADDILATVAWQTEQHGGECYVVSSDKDCRQLLTERVRIYNVRKNQVYDAAALAGDWGVRPEQVVDYQALVGDPVDHVPGVPLIGPKLARELLNRYGTLDAVLDRAHEVLGGKRQENVAKGRQQALLSRELVRLNRQVPIAIDWDRTHASGVDLARLRELFAQCGFHRFNDQVEQLFATAAPQTWQADYRTVGTPDALAQLVAELSRQSQISVDTETTGLGPAQADLVGLSFAWKPGEAYYVPLRAPAGEPQLDPAGTLAALRPVLENPAIAKLGQNLKYDMVVLRSAGIELAGTRFDTMMASYLLEAGERNHSLDELAHRYLRYKTTKIAELIGKGKQQKRLDEVPVAAVAAYAGEDADVALRLAPILAEKLRQDELFELFEKLELPLIEVLAELEFNGIKVDVGRLNELSRQYGERLAGLEADIYELTGHPFNIASPKQLQEILYGEQKLPVLAKTKTGPSTDAAVLEDLARLHPLPAKIIAYRQFAKLKNTYVDALPAMVNPKTGRVHASFHQAVAATGRLSSSDPNLQNIPIRSQAGREIRSAFLPGFQGWRLLAADYSQIELRVLAHFSGDETLRAAFEADEDIHARVASEVYNVALPDVTAEMRRTAKGVNFGVIYGQSPFGLARALGIEQEEAARFIDAYFARYRGVDEFLAKILAECRETGYVKTVLGRRRAIRGIRPGAGRQRNLPERTAINTVIQGSAADLIKQAMIAIHRRLRRERLVAKMLLQIHDELVFEAPPDELEYLAKLVTEEMVAAQQLAVPLRVDVKTGPNWAETEPWMGSS